MMVRGFHVGAGAPIEWGHGGWDWAPMAFDVRPRCGLTCGPPSITGAAAHAGMSPAGRGEHGASPILTAGERLVLAHGAPDPL